MRRPSPVSAGAFTLLELIAVMMLLTIMLAMAAPRLSGFFAGRALNEETRRLVALTRFGRSEAIARSERMRLWFNPESREYGLKPDVELRDETRPPLQFKLADKLKVEIAEESLDEEGQAAIIFWPDGSVDETSLTEFTLTEDEEPRQRIALAANRLEYTAQAVSADDLESTDDEQEE